MGGHATISVVGASPAFVDLAFGLADRCEELWSRFLPQSDISRLNWAEGRAIQVDPLTVRLIEAMREGTDLTAGDFDPTLLPQVIATGYAASTVAPELVTTLPQSAIAPGNLRLIEIDGTTVRMPLGTTLDAGGIGKGLAADLVCQLALAEGAWGIMAELGGDIVVAGEAPDGVAWLLGVEDPFDTSRHLTTVRIARGAIVTSSQRKRRFTTADGQHHHLVDPSTGASASTHIQTATVIAATGARAEALAKSGFMRAPQEFLDWLPQVGGAALLIDDAGEQHVSTNWERYT
ncbi:MAG: FAD:protein FMN transferase [Rhodoglobus sp.]